MSLVLSASLFIYQCYAAITHWDYNEDHNNISHWDDNYPECAGINQSPIDISINTDSSQCDDPLLLQWTSENVHFGVRNNGHSLQAVPFEIQHLGGSDITRLEVLHHTNDTNIRLTNSFYDTYTSPINSEYCFDSLHFHWGVDNDYGSEHAINGDHYPLEVHLVHFSCDYRMIGDALDAYSNDELANIDDNHILAVIGVLFEIGDANPVLDKILSEVIVNGIKYYDVEHEEESMIQLFYTEFNPMDLLPENKEFIGYKGSLTTPPCYETVRWNVLKDTMTVSIEQMEQFRMLLESTDVDDGMAPNWRPTQDIGNRTIYQCQDTVLAESVKEEEEDGHDGTHWDYNNTSYWVHDYPECGGIQQSPIDIYAQENSASCSESLVLQWTSETVHFGVRNNGHSLQAVPFEIQHLGGSDITRLEVLHHTNDTNIRLTNSFYNTYTSAVNSEYCFDSLHFHWGVDNDYGSEHAMNGDHYPLEVHLVHFSCDYHMIGDALDAYSNGELSNVDDNHILAVIGVLFEIGDANPVFDMILSDVIVNGIKHYDPEHDEQNVLQLFYTEFNPMDLLPQNKEFIGYRGSLTTPPCYETVRWNVMKEKMTVSVEQMERFRRIFSSADSNDLMAPNWRPLQDIGDRTVYECEDAVESESVEKEVVYIDDVEDDDDIMSVWAIIAVVFICLFSVAFIVIIYLSYMLYCKNKDSGYKKARSQSYQKADQTDKDVETGAVATLAPLNDYH